MLAAGLCVTGAFGQEPGDRAVPAIEAREVYGPEAPDLAVVPVPAGIPGTLAEAVNTALGSSPLLAASEAAGEGAQADLRSARWQRYPNLTAEVLTTTGGSNVADTDGLAANVALEQPVWTGGSISSQINQAQFNADAAASRVELTRQNLILDIVQAYYEVALYQGRIQVLSEGLDEYLGLSEGIERRVKQQVSPRVDLTLALSRIAQLEADLASARELHEIAYARLAELVGEEIVIPQGGVAPVPPVPPEELAAEELQACSPTLEERGNALKAAQAAQDNAEAQLYPRLLLQLSQNELTGARAALVLRAQTGNGLSKLSNIDRAEADVAQAIAELSQAERQVRTTLRRQYARYRSGIRGAEVSRTAAEASVDLLESYQRQFVAGRRSWLDLSNAVSEVLSARISQNDNQVASSSSATLILVLTCRWQPQG